MNRHNLYYLSVSLIFIISTAKCFAQTPTLPGILQTTWMGNNFEGGNNKWMQNYVSAVWVDVDGTVFTNSGWDEATAEAGFYKNGTMIGKMENLHGWNRSGGRAIAGDNNYIYVATLQGPVSNIGGWDIVQWPFPPAGENWYHIRRYNKNGIFAPFSSSSAIMAKRTDVPIRGCTVKGDTMYVTDINKVTLYNKNSNTAAALLSSFNLPNASDIVIANDKTLWIVIEKTNANNNPKIINYTASGTFIKEITSVVNPRGISLNNDGNLMVCEDGPLQQILVFDINQTIPALVTTIGDAYGINGGTTPGLRMPKKLNTPVDCGVDAAGNVYIGCTLNQTYDPVINEFRDGTKLGAEIKAFSPASVLLWNLYGLEFVGVGAADPLTDAANMYTSDSHYSFDLSKSNGEEWSYVANTIDKFKYPNDPRLLGDNVCAKLKIINGQRFLYTIDMYTDKLIVYRYDGEIAVPAAIFTRGQHNYPNSPAVANNQRVLWVDQNGDGQFDANEFQVYTQRNQYMRGWYVDDNGAVWQAFRENGIEKYTIQNVTNGVPKYSTANFIFYPIPAEFLDVQRLLYDTNEDALYLSGSTVNLPYNTSLTSLSGAAGTEMIKYTNWSNAGLRAVAYRFPLLEPLPSVRNLTGVEMAGDYIFFGEIINKNITWVYRKADGVFVGKMQPPANYINQAGWGLDTPYGITAYKRSNGEYIVISEEDLFNKNIVFRWCASGACNIVLATDDLVANGIYELAPLHANNMRLQTNTTTVQIGNANGTVAQKWKLLPAANGYGLAPLSTPKQRLSIQGVCNANAAAVDVAENNNALAQQWKLIRISNGVYELAPDCAPDKRLEVTGSGVVAGTNVQLWQTTNSNNQRWVLKLAGTNAPAATAVNIFPNPVRGNSFTINIKNNSRSKITVVLTGINGIKYNCKCTQIIAGSYTVVCDKILPPGSYIVTAITGEEVYTQKIIVSF